MERRLATLREVKEIKAIEGADMIELAIIDGWQCVVKKGEFEAGDTGVYFEIDSFLPIDERYEFLRKSSYKKIADPIQGQSAEGFRLKTIKLRGQISQGLILPLTLFPELQGQKEPGLDLTEVLRVEKYEAPVPASLQGEVKGMFPGFIKKTDEERLQNLPEYFSKYPDVSFECTEKIDGSSMTVYYNQAIEPEADRFGVCSRNLDLLEDDTNTLWKLTRDLKLEEILKTWGRNLALQGEIAGEGIQGNPLKIKGQKYFIFNVWDIDKREHLTPPQRIELIEQIKKEVPIEHVPVVDSAVVIFKQYNNMEGLLEFAASKSLLNPQLNREGLVFKSNELIHKQIVSFKVISNKYLLKQS